MEPSASVVTTVQAPTGFVASAAFVASASEDFPGWRFPTLDLRYDAPSQSVWVYYKAEGDPFCSQQTLIDMGSVLASIQLLFHSGDILKYPIRYFVMASRKPGVFNLGGDLAMFAEAIKTGDRETLRRYAHACIDVIYGLTTAAGLPIVTLSVVAGQALGGGLEAALAEDFVLADETARIGAPEVAFNTFPGMGAVTMLSRRLGTAKAEEIIASGRLYSGREMYEAGVVDVLAPVGRAEAAALEWMMDGGAERHARRLTLAAARRRFFPVSYNQLIEITDLWVDCSCGVTPQDIRHMERLASAQKRRF
jgi:DSF synthase